MNYFERRRLRKAVHHMLHEAAHARHMRSDIADAEDVRRLVEAEEALRATLKACQEPEVEKAADALRAAIDKVYPPRRDSKWRENVEVFAVALAVAMAFRTYFLQPFKIPTNSMWPTLYGITVDPSARRDAFDIFPLNLVRLAVFGEKYIEVIAEASGVPRVDPRSNDETLTVWIGGTAHQLPLDLKCWTFDPRNPPFVNAGQILAAGRRRYGDHIFVNRVGYNLHRPARGDIFVFSTTDVAYSGVRTNDNYIKRLVALPGETVRLEPPHLVVDDRKLTEPEPFQRMLTQADEYPGIGYAYPQASDAVLAPPRVLKLSATQYLPFGDNTLHSLDGRYFGPVEQARIIGPACFVYWPFGKRWGLTD